MAQEKAVMSIPFKDAELVPYAANFNARVNADYERYDLSEARAAAYTPLFEAYRDAVRAMDAARAEGTRSAAQTRWRSDTRDALLAYTRVLYAVVQADLAVADADKTLLGVHVPKTKPGVPAAPQAAPKLRVVGADGRTVTVAIWDAASAAKRGKPAHVVAALVFAAVGTLPPRDPLGWRFCGPSTRGTFAFAVVDDVPPGATVWACATWMNRRGEMSPWANAVSINIPGGAMTFVPPGTLRVAA